MGKNGWVKILDGSVVVKNPESNGSFAKITPSNNCRLYINGVEKNTICVVKEEDKIVLEIKQKEMVRNANINFSKDKLKAFLSINYENGITYKVEDTNEEESLTVSVTEVEVIEANLLSEIEILEQFRLEGIVYGVDYKKLKEIIKSENVKDTIVAEGIEPTEAIDDEISFLHNKNDVSLEPKAIYEAVDYKNLNTIESVSKGTIIAEVERGSDGRWGKNVLGESVIPKREYCKRISCGEGCKYNGNYILASIDGQVSFKKNKVTVNKIYSVSSDVDISTGNINFHGDVSIKGSVLEGMSVCAQNNIKVFGGVFNSNIISRGNTEILGNIMNSKLSAGGKDIIKEARIKSLTNLLENLEELNKTVEFLRDKNILRDKQSLGRILKSLIDTKFEGFNKVAMEAMSDILKDGDKKSKVLRFIKSKLIGIAILSVDKLNELTEGIGFIKEEIDLLNEEGIVDSTIKVNYCQESYIQSTGNIEVLGKGAFATEFYSSGQVIFKNSLSVCRGGKIKAKDYIKATTIGSEGGVQTIVEIEDKKGVIEIDKAYNNTLIIIGNKQKYINIPSKKIKCYIDKDGELIIEKFVL